MAHLRVTSPKGYDHYWTKAGAHTSFPYGFEGTVKAEVLAGAVTSGAGEDMDAPVVAHSLSEIPNILPPADKPKRLKIQDASDSA